MLSCLVASNSLRELVKAASCFLTAWRVLINKVFSSFVCSDLSCLDLSNPKSKISKKQPRGVKILTKINPGGPKSNVKKRTRSREEALACQMGFAARDAARAGQNPQKTTYDGPRAPKSRTWTNLAPTWANLGPTWGNFGPTWANLRLI